MSTVIDAAFVEGLQQLVEAGCAEARVAETVAGASSVTLTGLVEYGCLRWKIPTLPRISSALMASDLGRSLTDAVSARPINTSSFTPLDTSPRSNEFIFFKNEADIESQAVEFFGGRFANSAQASGFSKSVSTCLHAGLHEMMDNAVRHSASPARLVAGYHTETGVAEFVVADVGIGVLASLKSCAKYQHLTQHSEAIRLALHDQVTSQEIGGRGFNDIFKALALQWGLLRFRSGSGCVTIDGRGSNADAGIVTFPPALPGFQVSVACRNK